MKPSPWLYDRTREPDALRNAAEQLDATAAMTPATALALAEAALHRGMCPPARHADNGCQVCDDTLAAIEALRSLPVIRHCGDCTSYVTRGGTCYARHRVEPFRTSAGDAPPTWCPLRGAL